MRNALIPSTVLLFLLTFLVIMQAHAEESRQAIDPPRVIDTGWSAETDPVKAELLSELSAAKKRGDVETARGLEEQLARLRDPDQGLHLPDNPPGDDAPGIRLIGNGEVQGRWANDDVLVYWSEQDEICRGLDGTVSGSLVAAYERIDGEGFGFLRSSDGGETWAYWSGAAGGVSDHPTLTIGEGNESWLTAAFVHEGDELWGFRDEISGSGFSTPLIYNNNGDPVSHPSITTDSAEYPYWYTYVVSNMVAPDGWAVCVTRSLDFGVTWETPPQVLSFYCEGWNAYDARPDIAFGDGVLYVVYADTPFPCGDPRREVYVTRSLDYGVTWEPAIALTATGDLEYEPTVAAIHNNTGEPVVVVAYSRHWNGEDYDVWYAHSEDLGVTWEVNRCLSCIEGEDERSPDLDTSYSNGRIHTAFWHDYGIDYAWSDRTSPTIWNFSRHLNQGTYASGDHHHPAVGVNPTRPLDEEAGIVWTDNRRYGIRLDDIYYDGPGTTTDAEEIEFTEREVVASCLPNPFSTNTEVSFDLPRSGAVTLSVYDASGRKIRTLVSGQRDAGHHVIDWQGTDQNGKRLGTGVYFLRLTGEDFVQTRSVTLLR